MNEIEQLEDDLQSALIYRMTREEIMNSILVVFEKLDEAYRSIKRIYERERTYLRCADELNNARLRQLQTPQPVTSRPPRHKF